MAMKTCSNGHIYDDRSYSKCPLCDNTREKNNESTKCENDIEVPDEAAYKNGENEMILGRMLPPEMPPLGSDDDFVTVDQITSDKSDQYKEIMLAGVSGYCINSFERYKDCIKRRKKFIICAGIAAGVIAVAAVILVVCLI